MGFERLLAIVVFVARQSDIFEYLAIKCTKDALMNVKGGDTFLAILVLLFGGAVISAFLDNIPFVATMIPILLSMAATGMDVTPLWWAVSLGARLGGNGTRAGASANVVLAGTTKREGHELTSHGFPRPAFPLCYSPWPYRPHISSCALACPCSGYA